MIRRLVAGLVFAAMAARLMLTIPFESPAYAMQKGTKGKVNDKDGKDDLVGARWKLTVMEKAVEENVFRADKFKIYKRANEIGTFKQGREAITIEISKGKMEGTMELKLLKKDGTFYMGDWKTKDGETKKVKLELLND